MKIAITFPGSDFSSKWVFTWTELISMMVAKGIGVIFSPAEGSNVYDVRNCSFRGIELSNTDYDYLLTLDHDNPVSWDNFKTLLDAMEENKNIDILGGWTWIQGPDDYLPTYVNAGYFPKENLEHDLVIKSHDPIEVDWVGFAAVLIKGKVVKDLWNLYKGQPFHPIYKEKCVSDDIGFCQKAKDLGYKVFVHPEVYVEHLKLRPIRQNVVRNVVGM